MGTLLEIVPARELEIAALRRKPLEEAVAFVERLRETRKAYDLGKDWQMLHFLITGDPFVTARKPPLDFMVHSPLIQASFPQDVRFLMANDITPLVVALDQLSWPEVKEARISDADRSPVEIHGFGFDPLDGARLREILEGTEEGEWAEEGLEGWGSEIRDLRDYLADVVSVQAGVLVVTS